jgi:hypothetical protein
MRKKRAQGDPPTPRDIPVDVDTGALFSDEVYNLAETNSELISQEDNNPLREDWLHARGKGAPLYVVADDGRMYYIAVGGDGKAITVHSVVPRYEIQEGDITEYAGPDAWFTLEENLGRYEIIPTQAIADSSVAAHVAAVRNPIWFRAVQRLVTRHARSVHNPYKK